MGQNQNNSAIHSTIAAGLDRPASTVRRWLRGARGAHAEWLYQQGVQKVVAVDRDLLTRLAPQRNPLGWALNTLIGAAVHSRHVFGLTYPLWSLIGSFTRGHLIAPSRRT